jgi:hypothetical protein
MLSGKGICSKMLTRSRELIYALIAILFITVLYFLMLTLNRHSPAASSFYGHMMGILGFVLMIMTETLYSLRKRTNSYRWGKMSTWLEFHIFTGLVGPYMVLLHTSWKFNGLAGVVALFTLMIVISGVIGRYIYTAIPRSSDGLELGLQEINEQIRQVEKNVEEFIPLAYSQETRPISSPKNGSAGLVLGRINWEIRSAIQAWQHQRGLSGDARVRATQVDKLIRQRDELKRQAVSLATARRLLALWHAVHVPIGLSMFAMAFVHIAGVLYFEKLLH